MACIFQRASELRLCEGTLKCGVAVGDNSTDGDVNGPPSDYPHGEPPKSVAARGCVQRQAVFFPSASRCSRLTF
jgi:hypothetical protein